MKLFTSFVWNESVNLASQASYLTLDDFKKIHQVVTDTCARAGDAEHGFLSDPLQCKVKGEKLKLTIGKLHTYESIQQGPEDHSGRQVFAGEPYGSELNWSGVVSTANFEAAQTDAQMSMYGGNFFRNFVYQDRNWSFKNLDLDKTLNDAREIGKIMNATDVSFKGFKERRGKFIAFAGLADSIVTQLRVQCITTSPWWPRRTSNRRRRWQRHRNFTGCFWRPESATAAADRVPMNSVRREVPAMLSTIWWSRSSAGWKRAWRPHASSPLSTTATIRIRVCP